MIFAYYGIPVSQCEMANYILGHADCCNSPTPTHCIIPQGFNNISKNLTHWGVGNIIHDGKVPTFKDIQTQIDNDSPLLYGWYWIGGGGHVMVVHGYLIQSVTLPNDDKPTNIQLVLINDPWGNGQGMPRPGDQAWLPYDQWITATPTVDERAEAAEEEKATGVSTELDRMLWKGHRFAGYIANFAPPQAAQVKTESDSDQKTASGFGDAGHASHQSAEALAKAFLATVPDLTHAIGSNLDMADDAELALGHPYPIVHIRHDVLSQHAVDIDAHALLTEPTELVFPIYANDRVVSAITLLRSKDVWHLKSIGQRNMIAMLTDANQQHMGETGTDINDYFVISMPHSYQIFMAHSQNGQVTIVHGQDDEDHGFVTGATQTINDVINTLLPTIQAKEHPGALRPD